MEIIHRKGRVLADLAGTSDSEVMNAKMQQLVSVCSHFGGEI